jgi:hypothetical protein
MMICKGDVLPLTKDEGTVKEESVRISSPILRGLVLVVALGAFTLLLVNLLFGGKWELDALVFTIASVTLVAVIPKPETLREDEESVKARRRRLPDWSLVSYCVFIGLGLDWAAAFLWFYRRYAFVSGPVIGATSLLVIVYAAIGFLVARQIGGSWRTALLIFAVASWVLSGELALRIFAVGQR